MDHVVYQILPEVLSKYIDCDDTTVADIQKDLVDKLIAHRIGNISDGYHTFNELYDHRTTLFSQLCNSHPSISWKSRKHNDGDMFDGMFIAGMYTPDGMITYHCDITYWDMFHVIELSSAPEWDGHTPDDVLTRLESLTSVDRDWVMSPLGLPPNKLEVDVTVEDLSGSRHVEVGYVIHQTWILPKSKSICTCRVLAWRFRPAPYDLEYM